MDYKINEQFIKKIQAPILCKIDDDLKEFANGNELAETKLEKQYEISEIEAFDNKIVLFLKEKKDTYSFKVMNWVGEEAICQTTLYDPDKGAEKQYEIENYKQSNYSFKKNMLIVGAGGHGKVVKEVAEATGSYGRISFVDDNNPEAIGKLSDLARLQKEYGSAFVSIGNNHLRRELLQMLENMGFEIPVLIHPSAYVSKTCKIEKGTMIGPKAIVSANTYIGVGSIISAGAIIDHDVVLESCVHIDVGAIVKAGRKVKEETKLKAGEVLV